MFSASLAALFEIYRLCWTCITPRLSSSHSSRIETAETSSSCSFQFVEPAALIFCRRRNHQRHHNTQETVYSRWGICFLIGWKRGGNAGRSSYDGLNKELRVPYAPFNIISHGKYSSLSIVDFVGISNLRGFNHSLSALRF